MTTYIVFDNAGRTPDRYTIVDRESGNVFAACELTSESANTVRFCGNCADHRITHYVDRLNKLHAEGLHPTPGMPYIGPQNDGNSSKTAMAL